MLITHFSLHVFLTSLVQFATCSRVPLDKGEDFFSYKMNSITSRVLSNAAGWERLRKGGEVVAEMGPLMTRRLGDNHREQSVDFLVALRAQSPQLTHLYKHGHDSRVMHCLLYMYI